MRAEGDGDQPTLVMAPDKLTTGVAAGHVMMAVATAGRVRLARMATAGRVRVMTLATDHSAGAHAGLDDRLASGGLAVAHQTIGGDCVLGLGRAKDLDRGAFGGASLTEEVLGGTQTGRSFRIVAVRK